MATAPEDLDLCAAGSAVPRPALATDVPGAVAYTGQSRATLYKHMRHGLLPAFKNGARTILFYEDLDGYMRALPRAEFKPLDTDDTAVEPSSTATSV